MTEEGDLDFFAHSFAGTMPMFAGPFGFWSREHEARTAPVVV
jgi:hypothetical protein